MLPTFFFIISNLYLTRWKRVMGPERQCLHLVVFFFLLNCRCYLWQSNSIFWYISYAHRQYFFIIGSCLCKNSPTYIAQCHNPRVPQRVFRSVNHPALSVLGHSVLPTAFHSPLNNTFIFATVKYAHWLSWANVCGELYLTSNIK